ncbi:uncharacterized protein EKO05_0005186 [Ascochyta rabiei]|uniref:Integral component of membrane n=1 Tax=Didymella rabiei TaxID=5454 RepID=A0A163M3A8_DIDRA|nr:uncharacterized protein EKO05_0005186 [Ascochyta rabiei]KZM28362.1 integral component of membrane [Ascochyta rabiei]UPX14711.1 hypothetical protein EKO05_0005186 [Ascochyta rabiei]
MGKVFSKDAGLTGKSIEKYYHDLARDHAARAAADQKAKGQAGNEDTVNRDFEDENLTRKASGSIQHDDPVSEIIRTANVAPEAQYEASAHLSTALRALNKKEMDTFQHSMGALMKLGVDVKVVGRKTLEWVKAHPWETAAIINPLILLACTPFILGAVGFTSSGIAAGSIAAGIHAGIGSVAAGSAFATLTSAAMGGYGAIIVFGGVWAVPTAVLGMVAIWKRWKGGRSKQE